MYPNADVAVLTTNQLLYAQPAGAVNDYAETILFMPCTGSVGAGQTASFDIVYTASL
jgi:hypothetical protein